MNDQITNEINEEVVLSISDKIVGLFVEPSKLFSNLSKQKHAALDWAIPLVLLILLAISIQFLIMNNPALKQQLVDEQMAVVQKMLDDAVAEGTLSQEQADQRYDGAAERMDQQMGAGLIISIVSIIIVSLIFFFATTGIYVLVIKFGLKGNGTYKDGLTAYGLPGYIMVLQLFITIILMLLMTDTKIGTDAAKILGYDVKQLPGYLLSYIDPIKIWFYVVVGIAFAKMFKSENTGIYIATMLGIWFLFGIGFFALAQVVPFLQFMIR